MENNNTGAGPEFEAQQDLAHTSFPHGIVFLPCSVPRPLCQDCATFSPPSFHASRKLSGGLSGDVVEFPRVIPSQAKLVLTVSSIIGAAGVRTCSALNILLNEGEGPWLVKPGSHKSPKKDIPFRGERDCSCRFVVSADSFKMRTVILFIACIGSGDEPF